MVNENIASVVRSEGYFEPIPAAKVPNLANVYLTCAILAITVCAALSRRSVSAIEKTW